MEKDKQNNESEKKREKENERQKLAPAIGSVKQSTLLQPKTSVQITSTSAGSKRNLCGKLEELESESKRTDITVTGTKPARCNQ